MVTRYYAGKWWETPKTLCYTKMCIWKAFPKAWKSLLHFHFTFSAIWSRERCPCPWQGMEVDDLDPKRWSLGPFQPKWQGLQALCFHVSMPKCAQLWAPSPPDHSPPKKLKHAPSRWRRNCPLLSSHPQSPRQGRFRVMLLIFIFSWPHQKENSCQQPHPHFIVLWWDGAEGRVGFWKKRKKGKHKFLIC